MRRVFGGVGARDPDVGPTAKVDPAHLADVERGDVVDVAVHDPLEPVAHAEHIDRLQPGPDRGRPDHTIDPRRRAAADQDRQCPPLGHRRATRVTRTGRAACATPGRRSPRRRCRSTTPRPCPGAPPARSTLASWSRPRATRVSLPGSPGHASPDPPGPPRTTAPPPGVAAPARPGRTPACPLARPAFSGH